MPINIDEQLKILVELQGLDTQILKQQGILDLVPEKKKELDGFFEEKKSNLKALEDNVKALQLKRKEKEGDLAAKEGTIKKYQAQQGQVKTNKEYSALQEEIERVKADNSILEEDIIKIFDKTDEENAKIAKEKEYLKAEEGKVAQEKKKLDDDATVAKAELDGLKKARQELAVKVDKTILARYERLLGGKDGLAVVSVKGDACQGCFRKLPAQVINEIMMKQEIVVCENCARMLYIEE